MGVADLRAFFQLKQMAAIWAFHLIVIAKVQVNPWVTQWTFSAIAMNF